MDESAVVEQQRSQDPRQTAHDASCERRAAVSAASYALRRTGGVARADQGPETEQRKTGNCSPYVKAPSKQRMYDDNQLLAFSYMYVIPPQKYMFRSLSLFLCLFPAHSLLRVRRYSLL